MTITTLREVTMSLALCDTPTTTDPSAREKDLTDGPKHGLAVVRPEAETLSRQRLPYFVGVSGASAGSSRISMNLVVIPPLSAAEPHSHRGYETAVYMMKGRVDVRYGPDLGSLLTLEEGDFLFIPADVPHQPVNLDTEPAQCIVARNDANEQESVELFSHSHSHSH
jgi:uncharacterized RmlC-like cupin family protein